MIKLSTAILLAFILFVTHLEIFAQEEHSEEEEQSFIEFRLASWGNWIFRSFLKDETDDATTWGHELVSVLGIGSFEIKNIAYFEINDFPRNIPGQPPGNPSPGVEAATGIGDLITGFWVSKRGEHHKGHHIAPGIGLQIPTASDKTLGSGKWAIGPSFDYEYESGNLFAGAIAIQLWTFAGAKDRKDVNMLLVKPFLYYEFVEDWSFVYVPYGISVYWNKPSGENVYIPLGGGVQRSFHLGSIGLNVSAQFFNNVVRPSKGTVNDLRFLFELAF
ncbi:MAG: hypothetical protein HKO83_13245 [Ignavibacteriaceae bacterium]|nr:hypothetical protein [Ignavibacteriaceae bacterium]